MKLFNNIILFILLALNAFSMQPLKEGEYEELMSRGFEKLRPVKGLLPSGFSFDYDQGLAMYQYMSPVKMKGMFAVLACGEALDAARQSAWRRVCSERAQGLLMKEWLERIHRMLEDSIEGKLESLRDNGHAKGSGLVSNAYEGLVAYSIEYLYQQFAKYDFSCLCKGLASNCKVASGDCELKSQGVNAHFFYMECTMGDDWDENAAAIKDSISISTAIRQKLARDIIGLATARPSDWKPAQKEEMRRMAALIFALDNGQSQWNDFLEKPDCILPRCGIEWNEAIAHLFMQK